MGDLFGLCIERVAYDLADPATFDAWLASEDGTTLYEFAERGYLRYNFPEEAR